MKNIFLIIILFSSSKIAFGACASPVSRTNSSPNTVLTSTKYNTDLNTIYTHVNNIDGDCVQDSSIAGAKLEQSTTSPLTDAVKEGCKVSFSDANTLSVGKCYISVNGNFIKTTSATTVTWGCALCSAEGASTTYYLYAQSSSSLSLLISTTVPDESGYSGTSRVLGSFFNSATSAIDAYSIRQWVVNGLQMPTTTYVTVPGVTSGKRVQVGALVTDGASTTTVTEEDDDFINGVCTNASAGNYVCTFTTNYWSARPKCVITGLTKIIGGITTTTATATIAFENNAGTNTDVSFDLRCFGDKL